MRGFLSSCPVRRGLWLLAACILTWPAAGFSQPADRPDDAPHEPPAAEASGDESGAPRTRQEMLRRRREAKRAQLAPYAVSPPEERVRSLERWRLPRRLFAKGVAGFRPVVGGMPSGSGLVGGVGYIAGATSDRATVTADARYSTQRNSVYEAGVDLFPEGRSTLPVQGRLEARASDFRALRFFGLGGGSSNLDRTVYRVEERALEAGATVRPGGVVGFGATMQWMTADVGPGVGDRSVDLLFGAHDTPGFGTKTDYVVYGGQADLALYDRGTVPAVGVKLAVAGRRYDDRTSDRYDFTRVTGELQAHVPLGYRNRILALRFRTSHAVGHEGGAPPFWLMETLGGADTIRGFPEYRFRGPRNYLFNAEYRWEVWTYLDFALFYDAGKVFTEASALDLHDVKSGYGFGIRGHGPGGMVMRFDIAKSAEGFVLHIGSGPDF